MIRYTGEDIWTSLQLLIISNDHSRESEINKMQSIDFLQRKALSAATLQTNN